MHHRISYFRCHIIKPKKEDFFIQFARGLHHVVHAYMEPDFFFEKVMEFKRVIFKEEILYQLVSNKLLGSEAH